MPIISRTLIKLANRDDITPGMKRWRVDGKDGYGNRWVHGPFFALEGSNAEVIRDSAWPVDLVEDNEGRQGEDFVIAGGDPDLFPRDDLTLVQWRRRLARRFWRGKINTDRVFLCKIAPYIAIFTAVQIASVLGIPVPKAALGLAKAVDIRDKGCPHMDDIDAQAEEV